MASNGLKITFGLNLDGDVYPIKNSFSECVCGQFKLLKILEQRCGIKFEECRSSERINEYKNILKKIKDKSFYQVAFDFDDWSVAQELLSWRDALVYGGWDTKTELIGERLKIFAEVEKDFSDEFKTSIGDRILKIKDLLSSVQLKIDQLDFVDKKELLPKCWLNLFNKMEEFGVKFKQIEQLNRQAKIHRLNVDNEYLSADVLAEWIRAGKNNKDVVLIADQSIDILNSAFKVRNMPSLGFSADVENAPSSQVLLALLDLMDGPFDSQKMHEFLRMSGNPIYLEVKEPETEVKTNLDEDDIDLSDDDSSLVKIDENLKQETKDTEKYKKYYCREFCRVLEKFPGNENKKWKELEEQLEKDYPDYENFLSLASEDGKIKYSQLKKVLSLLLDSSKNNEFKKKISVFLSLADFDHIEKNANDKTLIRLKRLAQTILSDSVGYRPNDEVAECADFSVVSSPSKILSVDDKTFTFKYGIWWGFKDCSVSQGVNPWTNEELKTLLGKKIEPDSAEHIAERTTDEWHRAYNNIENLIIPVLKRDKGEEAGIHPFADELFDDKTSTTEVDLNKDTLDLADRTIKLKACVSSSKTDDKIVINCNTKLREKFVGADGVEWGGESVSSLEKLFKCPLKYYFINNLQLKKPEYGTASEYTTMGNVVHRVIEKIVCPKDDGKVDNAWLNNKKLETKVEKIYEQVLKEQAAYLNNQVRLGTKIKLLNQTIQNVTLLRDFINEYNLEIVGSEYNVFENLGKIEYKQDEKALIQYDMSESGRIDLLLRYKNTNNYFVLDFKNSDKDTYDALIRDGKSVQLSFYSKGVESKIKGASVINVGYFKLKKGNKDKKDKKGEIKVYSRQDKSTTTSGVSKPVSLDQAWKNVNDKLSSNLNKLQEKNGKLSIADMDQNQADDCCNYCDFKNICKFYVKYGEKHDKK